VYILNFHGLGEPIASANRSEARRWINASFFVAILEDVGDRSDLSITFDDSFESDYAIALPLLKAAGMTAKFFVVADRVDKRGFLSAKQIQTLRLEGMTIGSHGMQHRKWTVLNNRELDEEIVEARDRLEQITGTRIAEAACPFGRYNRRVLQRLREAKYDRVYTSDGGPADPNSWIQPRNTITREDDLKGVRRIIDEPCSSSKTALLRLKLCVKRWR
jgi:peptidoglycan/xylan/chitin deacetylase (PgdA/CDA1 family)